MHFNNALIVANRDKTITREKIYETFLRLKKYKLARGMAQVENVDDLN